MNLDRPETVSNRCLDVVQRAAEALSNERRRFDRFATGIMNELQLAGQRLAAREDRLIQEQERISLDREELDGQWAELDRTRTELELAESRAQAELETTQARLCEVEEESKQLHERLHDYKTILQTTEDRANRFEAERDTTRRQLAAANDELAKISTVFGMLESTQQELDGAQSQFSEFQEKAAAFNGRIERENGDLKHKLTESTRELTRLRLLAKDQQQKLDGNRSKWTEELRALRVTFEARERADVPQHVAKAASIPSRNDADEFDVTRADDNILADNAVTDKHHVDNSHTNCADDEFFQESVEPDHRDNKRDVPRKDLTTNAVARDKTFQDSPNAVDEFEFDFGASAESKSQEEEDPEELNFNSDPESLKDIENKDNESKDAVLGSILAQFQQLGSNTGK